MDSQMTLSTWESKVVSPQEVMKRLKPGMNIFLGTGLAEPRSLVKHLMSSESPNVQDLSLIQLVSLGDAISLQGLRSQRFRLKTFFSGWVASEAITEGLVDLIPSRFSRIPRLIESGQIAIDAAFVQITPPNEAGYCSLGVAVDVARQAMEQASLVVGEINPDIPVTYGDTFVNIADFHLLVQSTNPALWFPRWPVDEAFDRVAAHVASVIEDGSCIAFSIGPLFEALGRHLVHKRHLGVHSPFFTDPLMDLVKSGAVTNRQKAIWKGKSLASYAFGTRDLMAWLNRNPMVEFQGVDKVFDPLQIGRNPNFFAVLPARKVDLTGLVALHFGKGNVAAGPGEAMDFLNGAELSPGGRAIFALPSRNRKGWANIRLSVGEFPNQLNLRESVDMIVTEYGVANLRGRTLRERAQALIDIAHPDDRAKLVEQAKEQRILYRDQIFLAECARLYPEDISGKATFKGGVEVRFRAIRPSDEEEMRRLFYRFSDEAVYYRYFSPVKAMPHSQMQEYVNVDCNRVVSIVAQAGPAGEEHIIGEARFVREPTRPYADVAFVVDEEYQGLGIASYLYGMLIRLAKERGIKGFTADVLASNKAMMRVFEKGELPVGARLEQGVFHLTIDFEIS
jgi:acyl-CoA hydrolase/GNAT superfamily N-acetyltransferase